MLSQVHQRDRLQLADLPNAIRLARLYAAAVLSRWGVPADTIDTVLLLVSEMTTNAVRHPRSEAKAEAEGTRSLFSEGTVVRIFELALEIAGDVVRVSVWDQDSRPPILKEVGTDATGGRGVFIVAVTSSRWGHYPANGRPGKVVWAELPVTPPEPRRSYAEPARASSPQGDTSAASSGEAHAYSHAAAQALVGVQGI